MNPTLWLACVLLPVVSVCGQVQNPALAKATAELGKWVATTVKDRDDQALKRVVDAVMKAEKPGLDLLGARMKAADKAADRGRVDAFHTVLCHVGLRWLEKVEKSDMVFAGQYGELARLQPRIGEFFLDLLMETPEWFPIDRRWRVIPAIRDLYPKGPDGETLDQFQRMAENEIEPEYLRVGMSYALAQWGRRKLIKDKIAKLQKNADGKNEESALLALRDLAAIYYGIRDYSVAAVRHKEFLRRAEAAEYYIVPVDYYNAACCSCLSGDRRSALDYLDRCFTLNVSPQIDSSMRLKRKLFDRDPEIALVRATPQFAKLMERAFGKAPAKKPTKIQKRAKNVKKVR